MALRSVITTVAVSTLLAAPAGADQRERRRPNETSTQVEQSEPARAENARGDRAGARDRAVARTTPPPPPEDLQSTRRSDNDRRYNDNSRNNNSNGRHDNGRYDNGRYDNNRGYGYHYGARRYDSHNRYYYYYPAPRYIRPTIVHVVPYRPYVYRPSYSIGVYYGSGGYYPYGYTPSYYYQPVPGRPYGGLRITGAPREARVFADGYFVGLVNDFDGIFQHLNLEAGQHHIEIDWGGYQPIAFDVYVRPGETTTFRAGY